MSDFDRFDDFADSDEQRSRQNRQRPSYRQPSQDPQATRRMRPIEQPQQQQPQGERRQRYDGPRQADRNQYWSSRHNERAASRQSARQPQRDYDRSYERRESYDREQRQAAPRDDRREPYDRSQRQQTRRPAAQGRAPQGRAQQASRQQRRGDLRGAHAVGTSGADRYLSSYPNPSRRRWVIIAIAVIAVLLIAGIAFGISRIGSGNKDGESQVVNSQLAADDKMQAEAPPETFSISVSAVGDMIFGRNVGELIDAQGGTAPLQHVADILAESDVTIGNLESPLADGGDAQTWKDVILIGRPAAIEGLKACDFTFLSLANNHMLDYGTPALRDTLAALDNAGIGRAGAGMNSTEAWAAATAEAGGKTFAFLSFSDILPDGYVASSSNPGIAAARLDMNKVCDAIRSCKEQYDFVFVSIHWGVEYEDYANSDQVDEGHQAIDAGATAVFSEHPHVIQGVEFYNGGLIAYSLGDFVFDHYSRKTGESFILQLDLTQNGIENVRAIPTYLDEYGAPTVVTGDEATVILDRLNTISSGMNMTMEQRDSIGYMHATDSASETTASAA